MRMSWLMRLFSAMRKATPCSMKMRPTIFVFARAGAAYLKELGQPLFGDRHAFVGEDFQDAFAGGDLGRIRLQALGSDGQFSAHRVKFRVFRAQMAELVDAPVSGTGG